MMDRVYGCTSSLLLSRNDTVSVKISSLMSYLTLCLEEIDSPLNLG